MAETRSRSGKHMARLAWPHTRLEGKGFPVLTRQPQALTKAEVEAAEDAARQAGITLVVDVSGEHAEGE